MKVIICGGGNVGRNIAIYLSEESNDVTIIDKDPELIKHINENLDVSGIVGFASHPEVLKQAGAEDAELIIAATKDDEVNMVACQVAHSLFNVPKKIARVREQTYLAPGWANLFSRDQMPIDVVISPEVEVAKAFYDRIKIPGVFNYLSFADGKVSMASVICLEDCPLLNTPLKHLSTLFPDLMVKIIAVIRKNKKIIPDGNEQLFVGDEVYFVSTAEHFERSMAAFGHTEEESRRVLIIGAGKIGLGLAKAIQDSENNKISVKLIEANKEQAEYAASILDKTIVIHGDGLDKDILEEANIRNTEAVIPVMDHDESNVLSSLLAKEMGCKRAITLVNRSAYIPIVTALGVNSVVNPRAITVSTILEHVRRGKIKKAHSLRDGFAEIMEVEISESSSIINQTVGDIKDKEFVFCMVIRGEETILPNSDTVFLSGDRVIVLTSHSKIAKIEKIFAIRPEYF